METVAIKKLSLERGELMFRKWKKNVLSLQKMHWRSIRTVEGSYRNGIIAKKSE